jgi:hypothetical protein
MVDWRLVEQLAWEARRWTEKYKENFGYTKWQADLAGLCAKATAKLNTLLAANNINSEIVANTNHVFNYVDDFVVDTTATQFNGQYVQAFQKVEVRPYDKAYRFRHWWIDWRFANAKELEEWMSKAWEYSPCKR